MNTITKGLVYASLGLGLAAQPSNATLQLAASVDGVQVLGCVDNQASSLSCPGGDLNPAVGTLLLQNNDNLNGVELDGSVSSSIGTPSNPSPFDVLNTSSLNIINHNGDSVHIQASVSDTDFAGPVDSFSVSTSGTFQFSLGSSIENAFFNDPENRQGARRSDDTPGTLLDAFSFTPMGLVDSYSHTQNGVTVDNASFSMTQFFDMTLAAGGELVSRGGTEVKSFAEVPEPFSTLGMLGMALLLFGIGHKTYRTL